MKENIIFKKVPTSDISRAFQFRKKRKEDSKAAIIQNVLLVILITCLNWSSIDLFKSDGVTKLFVVLTCLVLGGLYIYYKYNKIQEEYEANMHRMNFEIITLDKETW